MLCRAAAQAGALSLPVAHVDAKGQPVVNRLPITLDACIRNPKVYAALLMDTMLRTGRGLRKPSQRRGPRDDRRKDKPGTTKLTRRLAGQASGMGIR